MTASLMTLVVVGTGTEVGKTWVSCELLKSARQCGMTVSVRKPAQSFEGSGLTDADLLGAASGEPAQEVCLSHRSYPVPMAPPMAAEVLNLPRVLIGDLIEELRWQPAAQFRLLETAGGLRSPIAHDGDNLELLKLVQPSHVLLIADAGLGTINTVRLCMSQLTHWHTTVVLNRFDASNDLHRRNREWLGVRDGLEVIVDVRELVERWGLDELRGKRV
jgi:dethiobiotin synthetase